MATRPAIEKQTRQLVMWIVATALLLAGVLGSIFVAGFFYIIERLP